MKLLMKIEGTATQAWYGTRYLEWFRPENRKKGLPMISFTEDKTKAMRFETTSDLFETWRTSIGTRLDGKPDRPLTVYTISTVTFEEETANA